MERSIQAVICVSLCVCSVQGHGIWALVTGRTLPSTRTVLFMQIGANTMTNSFLIMCVFGTNDNECFNSNGQPINYVPPASDDATTLYLTNTKVTVSYPFLGIVRDISDDTTSSCKIVQLSLIGTGNEYMILNFPGESDAFCSVYNTDTRRLTFSCSELFQECPGCNMSVIVTEFVANTSVLSSMSYVCRSGRQCTPDIAGIVSNTAFLWAVINQGSCPRRMTTSTMSSNTHTFTPITSEATTSKATTSESKPTQSASEPYSYTLSMSTQTEHTADKSTEASELKSKIKSASLLRILLPVVLLGLLLIALIIFVICWRRRRKLMESQRAQITQQITQQNAYEEIDSARGKNVHDPGVHYEEIPEKRKPLSNKTPRNSNIEMFDNTYYVSSGKTDIENVYDEASGVKYDTPENVINQNLNQESLPVQDSKDRSGNALICRNTNNSKETNIATSTASVEDINDGSDIEMFDNDVYDRTVS